LKHAQESLSLINKEKHVPAASPTAAAQMAHNQNQVPAPSGHNEQQLQQHSGVASGNVAAGSSAQLPRAKPDARVIVFERKTGRLLAGMFVCPLKAVDFTLHHSRDLVTENLQYGDLASPTFAFLG
jgi:hypothetical protein